MNIRDLIEKTSGRFFRVKFVKRSTGLERTMVCRTGVHKGLTGKGMKFSPTERNLKVVWATKERGYRCIPLESVREFSCGAMKWRAT